MAPDKQMQSSTTTRVWSQALHHHEAVGRFPDLGALFAVPRSAGVSPAPSLQRLSSGYGPRLSGRGTQQVGALCQREHAVAGRLSAVASGSRLNRACLM